MERMHQMNVIPGRPSVAPSEYRCLYQGPPDASCRPDISQSWYRARRVPQSQADNRASDGVRDRLHLDTRLYTMMLVDSDVPDPENETFTTFLHWLWYVSMFFVLRIGT